MSLRALLSTNERPITKGEQRILEVLLSDPVEAVSLRASEVAAKAGVHESVVTRLAQKLSYDGYRELREDLRRDIDDGKGPAREHLRESAGYELSRLIQDEIADLSKAADLVPQEALDTAASDILSARKVYIFGNPYAKMLIDLLDRRLRRLGVDVVPLSHTGRELAEHLLTMGGEDVLIVFALRKPPVAAESLLKDIEQLGGRSIVITDVMGLSLQTRPTHLIAAPRGPGDTFSTQIVPAVLCYALQLAVYHLDKARADSALERLAIVTRAVDQTERSSSSGRNRGNNSPSPLKDANHQKTKETP